ncbi:MAG: hypothetical protein ACLFWB_02995 [Armatimonadota bacterium]
MRIDAKNVPYRELNEQIHDAIAGGNHDLTIENVQGQRYIGAGLEKGVNLQIEGVPGQDLAAFMDGAQITVNANVQDGVANTMNDGRIVVRGDAGDICGHSMRGGSVLVEGLVGWRCGIHCKAFGQHYPTMVVGTTAGAYLGEYMAGGLIAVLNIEDSDGSPVGNYCGTGMHAGLMFVRGHVEPYQLGAECGTDELSEADWDLLRSIIEDFCAEFGHDADRFAREQFIKIFPKTSRPYGRLYAY